MRILIGISGASGSTVGAAFVRRCPGDKYLVVSPWGWKNLEIEAGLGRADLEPHVKRIFEDDDLAAPPSSGSNAFDATVIVPTSLSTLAKIAAGLADTLITRMAQVALKERRKLVLCLRETPLSSIALENALKLSRDGVMIMPVCPPFYRNPESVDEMVNGYVDKVLMAIGAGATPGWRSELLD
ncbi:MAG: UbiX family flavin prenyltransferase [Candidatus Eisenbacteria bacterium]|nr:UbiX family flavin prenyltransferase [Candidatus Eisenbacteria bacterium]